ncbi:hypothetical protein [Sandarakinorhabdus sp.]|uniref:hypothetical protein n=1 Tax=Sandarakinorhabdus sp. TaxID=1916663 RepID=UPI003F6F90CC
MKFLLSLSLIALAACGVEQSRPAPVANPDDWGLLEPDAARPMQAENAPPADTPPTAAAERRRA